MGLFARDQKSKLIEISHGNQVRIKTGKRGTCFRLETSTRGTVIRFRKYIRWARNRWEIARA
jgi:hypothetical protein